MFQNAPSVASTFLDNMLGTRLNPTLTSSIDDGSTPASVAIVFR